MKCDFKG